MRRKGLENPTFSALFGFLSRSGIKGMMAEGSWDKSIILVVRLLLFLFFPIKK